MKRSDDGPDGLLLVDKTAGPTSHDVVRMVRQALRTRRVGHAGTLDPFATGLLVCGVGRATRLLRFFSASEKTYEGVIRLGFATDTGDATGEPLSAERDWRDAVARAPSIVQEELSGDLMQVPPMYSAKKIAGVALHHMARRGETVERQAVPVRVHGWTLVSAGEARLRFEVTCSAGTYVRVLASELGELLGCGAHLESLRRTRSGVLRVEDAVGEGALRPDASSRLIPIDEMPLPLPSLRCLDAAAEKAFLHGAPSPVASWAGEAESEAACRSVAGTLLGVAAVGGGEVRPDVVLAG